MPDPSQTPDSDPLGDAVYRELRLLAEHAMRRERIGHTLQPTALVNEAWLRLSTTGAEPWRSRTHFLGAAARAMRRILVEHARGRARRKRGAGWKRTPLDEALAGGVGERFDVIAIDQALQRLARRDRRKGDIVELRFFAGLSIEETAEQLGLSPATVKRDWEFARAWLHHELDGEERARAKEDP